jgi:hypothetical protein
MESYQIKVGNKFAKVPVLFFVITGYQYERKFKNVEISMLFPCFFELKRKNYVCKIKDEK